MGSCQSNLCDKNGSYKKNFSSLESIEKYINSNPTITSELKNCDHYNEGASPGLYCLLEYYISKKRAEDVRQIIAGGVDVNKKLPFSNEPPLLLAYKLAYPQGSDESYLVDRIIENLLQNNAEVSETLINNEYIEHPDDRIAEMIREPVPLLFDAVIKRHSKMVMLFLHYKADLKAIIGSNRLSVLHKLFKSVNDSNYLDTLNFLRILYQNGVDINARDIVDETAMHSLFICSNYFYLRNPQRLIETITDLTLYGANVNLQNVNGNTASHLLIQSITINRFYCMLAVNDCLKILSLFAKYSANFRIQNKFRHTPLHCLLENRDKLSPDDLFQISLHLIQLGADVNAHINGNNALHLLVSEFTNKLLLEKIFEIMQRFITSGIDINAKNTNEDTVLHLLILSKCNGKLTTNDCLKFLTTLANYSADFRIRNKNRNTPLDCLLEKRDKLPPDDLFQISFLLIQLGADVNTHINGNNALHLLVSEFINKLSLENIFEIIQRFITSGIDINAKNTNEDTILHLLMLSQCNNKLTTNDCLKCLSILANYSADFRIRNKNKNTPLELLLENRDKLRPDDFFQIFFRLVQFGSDINTQVNGNNALHILVPEFIDKLSLERIFEIMQHLITLKININAENKNGDTILHLSFKHLVYKCSPTIFFDILNYLLTARANVFIQNNDGNTALHLLFKMGNMEKFETNDYITAINLLGKNKDIFQIMNKNGYTPATIFMQLFDKFGPDSYFQILHSLLQNGMNVNFQDRLGNTALHLLLQNPSTLKPSTLKWIDLIDLFKLLIQLFKVNVSAVNANDNTALHLMLNKVPHCPPDEHFLIAINMLLTSGINVQIKNFNDESALDIVLRHGVKLYSPDLFFQVVLQLVQLGADIRARIDGNTILHILFSVDCVEKLTFERFFLLLRTILILGVNINEKDNNGNTVLHSLFGETYQFERFSLQNFNEIIKLLKMFGADFNAQNNNGNTAMHTLLSSSIFYSDVVKTDDTIIKINLLVSFGTDLETKNNAGKTALMILTKEADAFPAKDFCEMLNALLKLGANVNDKDEFGNTCLQNMLQPNMINKLLPCGFVGIIQSIIESGADVNAVFNTGNTILHLLFENHDVVLPKDVFLLLVDVILDAGIDINAVNANYHTALWCAVQNIRPYDTQLGILELLIAKGADTIDRFDKKQRLGLDGSLKLAYLTTQCETPYLHKIMKDRNCYWMLNENLHEISTLCNLFSDQINVKDSDGMTPIFYAMDHNQLQFIKALVEQGAKLNILCKDQSIIQRFCPHLRRYSHESFVIIKFFIEKSVDFNHINSNNCPILHNLLQSDYYSIRSQPTTQFIELFLNAGIDLHMKDKNDNTCVYLLYKTIRNQSVCYEVLLCFTYHMIKVECLSGKRMQPISLWESIHKCMVETYRKQLEMNDYRDRCKKELKMLKIYSVCSVKLLFYRYRNKRTPNHCSFYDVLSLPKQRLAQMADFRDFRLTSLNNYEKLFPIYGVMLYQKIKQVKYFTVENLKD